MLYNGRVYDQLIYGFETQNIDIMSKVNRSTYQKAVEENKKLITDIKLLVEDGLPSAEKILCIAKWREKFKKEKEFNSMMKQAARQYIKDHADELPDFLTRCNADSDKLVECSNCGDKVEMISSGEFCPHCFC